MVAVLSALTVFLLHHQIITACDTLRWTLCAKPSGVSLLVFTALGKVAPLQLVEVLFTPDEEMYNGVSFWHRAWAAQR